MKKEDIEMTESGANVFGSSHRVSASMNICTTGADRYEAGDCL